MALAIYLTSTSSNFMHNSINQVPIQVMFSRVMGPIVPNYHLPTSVDRVLFTLSFILSKSKLHFHSIHFHDFNVFHQTCFFYSHTYVMSLMYSYHLYPSYVTPLIISINFLKEHKCHHSFQQSSFTYSHRVFTCVFNAFS